MYLHGLPYAIAPNYQTKVPMVFWFNDTWIINEGIDMECVKNNAALNEFSHDNYFHTIYGMMDMKVDKEVYDSNMDILEQCRVSLPSDKLAQLRDNN